MLDRRQLLKAAAAAPLATALARPAIAQGAWPNRAVRVVVPFPAGGTTDVIARIVCQKLSEVLGQPFVVENRGGAGGALGADVIAKAPAEGYTLMMHNGTFGFTTMVLDVARRPMHQFTDFAPVSLVVNTPFVLMVHPSVQANTLADYMAFLRANPNAKHFYGSTGPGSTMHLFGEILRREARIDFEHVPFRGAAPLVQDLIAGRIQFGGDQITTSISHIRSGALKAVATTASRRIGVLPDLMTATEQGLGAIEFNGWNGFFVRAGTPQEIIDRLQRETAAVCQQDDVRRRISDLASDPVGSSAAVMAETLQAQVARFRPIIEQLRINPEG